METSVIDGTRHNQGMQNAILEGFQRFKLYLIDIFERFFGSAPPSRDLPVTVLFVGQKNVGKTTAAQYVCTSMLDSAPKATGKEVFQKGHPKNSFVIWKYASRIKQVNFVEVPAFESSGNHDHNAKVVTALNSYLKKEPRAVPNLVCITASLTDSRLVGPASNFSNMLNCLKYQGNRLMTIYCSNIILCLTNIDSPDIRDTLEERKIAYENQCEEILGIKPLFVMMIGNENVNDSVSLAQNKSAFDYFRRLVESDKYKLQFKKNEFELLQADIPALLTSKMLSNDYDGTDIFSERENITFVPNNLSFGTNTVQYENILLRTNNNIADEESTLHTLYNLVEAQSKIILANGTAIQADQCVIGDRVLGHLGVGVITDVNVNVQDKCEKDASNVAKIHVVVKQANTSLYLYYDEGGKSFIMQNKLNQLHLEPRPLIYLEVNGGNGSIIVDGYVRKCSAMCHQHNEVLSDDECLVTRL